MSFFEESVKPVCYTNHTQYTLEKMKKLIASYHYKSRIMLVFLTAFFVLVSALTIVAKVLARESISQILIPTIPSLFLLLAIVVLWQYANGAFYSHREFAQDTRMAQHGVHYIFTDTCVFIRSVQPGVNVNLQFDYSVLYAVHETPEEFFLYTQERRAYIVDKSGFTTGDSEQVKALMMGQMSSDRYVIYR